MFLTLLVFSTGCKFGSFSKKPAKLKNNLKDPGNKESPNTIDATTANIINDPEAAAPKTVPTGPAQAVGQDSSHGRNPNHNGNGGNPNYNDSQGTKQTNPHISNKGQTHNNQIPNSGSSFKPVDEQKSGDKNRKIGGSSFSKKSPIRLDNTRPRSNSDVVRVKRLENIDTEDTKKHSLSANNLPNQNFNNNGSVNTPTINDSNDDEKENDKDDEYDKNTANSFQRAAHKIKKKGLTTALNEGVWAPVRNSFRGSKNKQKKLDSEEHTLTPTNEASTEHIILTGPESKQI